MSLLQALKNRKLSLKTTDTVVTRADGRQFIESNNKIIAIENRTYGFIVDTKPDDIPAQITDVIYLGSQDCCESSVLSKYDIAKVLSIGIRPVFIAPGVTYKHVECLDLPATNIIDILMECVPFIRSAISGGDRILIHCNAGVSRSSAIVIGFLMLENKLEYDDAYDIVKKARNSINPNCGFVRQLKTL